MAPEPTGTDHDDHGEIGDAVAAFADDVFDVMEPLIRAQRRFARATAGPAAQHAFAERLLQEIDLDAGEDDEEADREDDAEEERYDSEDEVAGEVGDAPDEEAEGAGSDAVEDDEVEAAPAPRRRRSSGGLRRRQS